MDEGSVGQELPIRAPGPALYKKKYFLGRFPLTAPDFSSDAGSWSLHPENAEGTSSKPNSIPRTWLLENPQRLKPNQKGIMEGGISNAATYFVLIRQEDEFVAVPVDHWFNFKPLRNEADASLEDLESDMKKGDNLFANRLVPKSVAKQEEDQDVPKSGRTGLLGADGEREGRARKRKPGKGIKEEDDEAPEDLYAGVEDELRPERPEQAEDWEHELNADDDDEEMGDDLEERLEDDPGERKKLGLEEEEEEELDEAGRAIKKLVDRENNSDEDEAAPEKPEEADGDEDELDEMDEETMDLDEVFKDEEGGEGKPARTSRSASPAPGPRGEGPPSRKRTPPPPTNRRGGGAGAPPGGGKRKGEGAAAEDQAKRARMDTKAGASRAAAAKPVEVKQEGVAVKSEPGVASGTAKPSRVAPAAGAAAARRPPAHAAGAAAAGLPTPDEIKQVVGSNRFSVKALISHFKGRIKKEDTGVFQKTVLSVAKLSKGADGQSYLELK